MRAQTSTAWVVFVMLPCIASCGGTVTETRTTYRSRPGGSATTDGGTGDNSTGGTASVPQPRLCPDQCPGSCLADHCSFVVATGGQLAGPIAVNATHAYWVTFDSVMRVALDGTDLTTFASNQMSPLAIALADQYVYWSKSDLNNAGSIMRIPLSGGTPAAFEPAQIVNDIAADATNLYWPDRSTLDDGTIVRAGLSDGSMETIATGQSGPGGIAVDAANVYWTNFRGTVMKLSLGGGTPTELSSESSSDTGPASIAVDSTYVYWTHSGAAGTVKRILIAGGDAETLATGQEWPQELVVSDGYLYWTNSGESGGGSVMRMPVGGGSAQRIAEGPGPSGLAVDSTYAYWTDFQTGAVTATEK